MTDARFEDGAQHDVPLRLMAEDSGDLPSLSALVQDAVFTGVDMAFVAPRRRLALLLTRLRWEDRADAESARRPYERVKSLLVVESITALRTAGFNPKDAGAVQSLLAMTFAARDELGGTLTLVLAGGGAIAMDVECVDITLRDVTRPHRAVSQVLPSHET
jgi:hypothetical protein